MNVVAITACQTGIAHCYMAAERLMNAAKKLNLKMKVETQGAMGIDNRITAQEFDNADLILLVTEIALAEPERYQGKKTIQVSLSDAINKPVFILKKLS